MFKNQRGSGRFRDSPGFAALRMTVIRRSRHWDIFLCFSFAQAVRAEHILEYPWVRTACRAASHFGNMQGL